jgi:hypothetical protein
MRGIAFRRMAGTPRALFYSVAASRCAFGGWWGSLCSRPWRARNPVNGLYLAGACTAAPGRPAPYFCVNGSRGDGAVLKTGPFSLSKSGRYHDFISTSISNMLSTAPASRKRSHMGPAAKAKRLKRLRTNPDFTEAVSEERAAAKTWEDAHGDMMTSMMST